jgi:hypothetical protein
LNACSRLASLDDIELLQNNLIILVDDANTQLEISRQSKLPEGFEVICLILFVFFQPEPQRDHQIYLSFLAI